MSSDNKDQVTARGWCRRESKKEGEGNEESGNVRGRARAEGVQGRSLQGMCMVGGWVERDTVGKSRTWAGGSILLGF